MILKYNNNNPLLKEFTSRVKATSIEWWGVKDDDHITKDGVIHATLYSVENHWVDWKKFGESACMKLVEKHGMETLHMDHLDYQLPNLSA